MGSNLVPIFRPNTVWITQKFWNFSPFFQIQRCIEKIQVEAIDKTKGFLNTKLAKELRKNISFSQKIIQIIRRKLLVK